MARLACLVALPLFLAGCVKGETHCSCAQEIVSLSIPAALAPSVVSVTVGPQECGFNYTGCRDAIDGGGCRTYVTILQATATVHDCRFTVQFADGSTSSVDFSWQVASTTCCGTVTYTPSPTLLLPDPPDAGPHDAAARD